MARRRAEPPSDEENIITRLRYGSPQVLVILIIPSHDRRNARLNDQHLWASEAMNLFGHLYTGATAFQALDGVFLDDDEVTLLHDKPILVESYVEREMVEDPARLRRLLDFARRMGRETRQAAVGVVVGDVLHIIRRF
jgi:hypothetical protein